MQEIDGKWTIFGVDWNDPACLHSVDEAIAYIKKVGFLPFFANEIPGFSLEEHTASECWWGEDPSLDPWKWREVIARTGEIAYGKFFEKRTGFIAKEWIPYFSNYRRDGYDFDALWDDGKAYIRQKKIMDVFDDDSELFSYEAKQLAGFGKGGEKNFEGTITSLQMQMYLTMKDFQRKKNKSGQEYGWEVTIYSKPEHLWGYDFMASRYKEAPEDSFRKIADHVKKLFPAATEKQIMKVLK